MVKPGKVTSRPRVLVGAAGLKGAQRAAQAAQRLNTELGVAAKLLDAAAKQRPQRLGVLRRLFTVARKLAKLLAPERNQLVDAIEKAIANDSWLQPKYLGCRDWRGVAKLIVQYFEDIESLSAPTFKAFSALKTRRGHEAALRGVLFNRFVRYFTPLWNDLKLAAKDSVQRLNQGLRQERATGPRPPKVNARGVAEKVFTRLVNALGDNVEDSGDFSEKILRGKEVTIVLKRKGTKGDSPDDLYELESVDDVLITSAGRKGGGLYWLFPAEIESKTPGAARGFGKQIGLTQVRFGEVDVVRVELTIEGSTTRTKILPDSLVFDRHDSTNYAVSSFTQKQWKESLNPSQRADLRTALETIDLEVISRMSQFRGQSTKKGGGMSFRRLDLAVDISPMNRMIRSALLAGLPPRP